jgi:rhodanese-related sulfurtransferase
MTLGRGFSWKGLLFEVLVVALGALVATAGSDWIRALSSQKTPRARPAAIIGAKVGLKPNASSEHSFAVVVVASANCVFCQRSISFYQTLWAEAKKSGVPLYFALPAKSEAATYLNPVGLGAANVTTWDQLGVKVDGTPTILIIDRSATVRRTFHGMLGAETAAEVLDLIASPSKLAEDTSDGNHLRDLITEEGLKMRAQHHEPFTVIDIREREEFSRDHRPNSINIPLAELYVRAHFELDPSYLQVINCVGVSPKSCQYAAASLQQRDLSVKLLASSDGPVVAGVKSR